MPGGIVCYITRAGAGSMIRGVRIVAAGLVREWTAPESTSVSSVDSAGPSPAVAAAQAAAQFVVHTLDSVGMKRLAAVCMDADGAVCAWLSAPSPEPSIVRATIEQSALEGDATGAGVGAARLLSMSTGAPGTGSIGDVSVQALAAIERKDVEETGGLKLSALKNIRGKRAVAAALAPQGKTRYAVLAVPDAPVRVFLDELDAKGVEVQAVLTLWHALAAGWDQSGAGENSPASAIVLVEPEGRLIWSWTRGGELLAGGAMRLSTYSARASEDRALASAEAIDAQAPVGPSVNVDFSEADAGRLAMDWLAWSAQLGQVPTRVICVTGPNVATPSGEGPQVLPRLLAKLWPGSTIDAAVNPDPIGATLGRLAGLGPARTALPETGASSDRPAESSPRSALVDLSSRPGLADRALYRWAALALVAMALVIGAIAWQVYRSVGSVRERIADTSKQRAEVLDELRLLVRGDDNFAKLNKAELDNKIAGARKQQQDVLKVLRAPKPVLDETSRLLAALDGVPGVKLTEYEMNNMLARATITLPAPPETATPEEAEKIRNAGATILEKLRDLPGVLSWKGEAPAFNPEGQRRYLLSAIWPEKITPVNRTPAPSAPAASTPATNVSSTRP